MSQFDLSNFNRFLLSTENDNQSPLNEEMLQQIMYNLVGLLILALDTGQSGSATSDPPNDTTGVLTDTGASYSVDEHNGRTLLMTSGTAKGLFYTIDDTTATTLVCTGDNLYSDGVRSGDTYKILYDLKVNLDGHDHDGINSKSVVLADSVVTQAKLKTTYGSVSIDNGSTSWQHLTLPGGEYGFYPLIKSASADILSVRICEIGGTTSYVNNISMKTTAQGSGSYSVWASQRYVTSSGEVFWIFILRSKHDEEIKGKDVDGNPLSYIRPKGSIISMWQAPDHPCFGNGGKPLLVSHPFGNYDKTKHEIIVINPTETELQKMRAKTIQPEDKPDKDLLEVILEDYEIDEISKPKWPTKKVTVGLPPDWDEAWRTGQPVIPVKKIIPKPDYVMCKKLKIKK